MGLFVAIPVIAAVITAIFAQDTKVPFLFPTVLLQALLL